MTNPTPTTKPVAPELYTKVESNKDIAAATAAYAGLPILAPVLTAIDYIVQTTQNAGLAHSVLMGNDRALEPVNWNAQSHQQMYSGVHDQNDPSSGANQGNAWVEIGNALAELNGHLADAVKATIDGWQGSGGDAARAAVLGLAQWGGQSAQAAQFMGSQMSHQTDAASTAKNSMPEPDNFDPETAYTQAFTQSLQGTRRLNAASPNPDGSPAVSPDAASLQAAAAAKASMAQQADASEAKRQQAVQVMKTYETTSTGVDESTPVFVPPPDKVNGGTGGGSSYSGTPVSVHSASYVAPTGATFAPTGGGLVPVGTPGGSAGPISTTGTPIAAGGGVSTPVSSSGPGGQLLEGGRTVGAFGGAGTPSTAAGSYGAGGAGANGLPGVGAARAGSGIAGGPVPVGGASGDQVRSHRAYGPGLRYSGQGGTGLAGRSGIESPAGRGGAGGTAGRGAAGEGTGPRSGGSAAGEGSGPRGAGAGAAGEATAGRAGASGASGAGGRGKGEKGEEDGEHETPDYLKTIDLFGTTQVVAPAVIGE
jgi:hypothetical protein